MSHLVLDYVKHIQLDTENPPLDNYQALEYLPVGLHFLAITVRNEELRASNLSGNLAFMGNPFPHDAEIACCFNWFSTSIVNYLRLVGLIDIMGQHGWTSQDLRDTGNQGTVKNHCVTYVKEVIPEIYRWRNKIAAHFAITDPEGRDNLGTLEYSVMNPIMYIRPYFETGGFTWSTKGEESEMPKWALTQAFETLTPRLWPNSQLAKVQ